MKELIRHSSCCEDGYDVGRRVGEKAMEKLLSEPKKANNGSVQP